VRTQARAITQDRAIKIRFKGPAAKAASMFCADFSSLKAAAPSDSRAEMSSHADTEARTLQKST